MKRYQFVACAAVLVAGLAAGRAWPQLPVGTAFTYQGQLKQSGVPITGTADFEFTLWNAEAVGARVGAMDPHPGVNVVNGLFTIQLDFGSSVFAGDARWLEVQVAYPSGGPFTLLSGRQAITPAPYAMTAMNTVGVDGSSLDAPDGSPTDAVRVDHQGRVLMEKGGLLVFDDAGQGISLTSDTFDFIEGTSEDPVYAYSSADDTHKFYTNGTRRVVIDADGDVGIGEVNPAALLHLGGTAGVDGIMFPDGTLQTTASVGGGGSLWTLDQPGRISYDGEVTIGTTNTTASLKVLTEEGPAITASVAGEVGDGIVVSTVGVGTRAIVATASGEESYGLDVSVTSTESIAIYAIARGANGTGINVLSTGSNGVTIKANARTDTQVAIEANATGTATLNEYPLPNTAGKFYASGDDGVGILGRTDGSQSYGVHGKAEGSTGRGVYGEATLGSGTGLYGHNSSSTGSAIAVRGHTESSSGFSSYFTGGKNYFAGRVGLGKLNPEAKLHIGGTPNVDGIMFPDGTLQTTAAVGGGGGSLWSGAGGDIFYTAGNVGIGTSSPSEDLQVVGDSRFDGNVGIGTAPSTFSALQVATGTLVGMKSSTSFSLGGAGIWGEASSGTGETIGVYGTAASSDGVGVKGESAGIGVEGVGGNYGVRGEADGSVGFSFGVSGTASTESGRGVTAYNSATEGDPIAIWGGTASSDGFGGFFQGRGYFRDAVNIGGSWEPANKLTVRDDPFYVWSMLTSIGVRDHTALIENEHTPGIFQRTGVLALRANSPIGGDVNYITFYQKDAGTGNYARVGSIEGDGGTGIVLESLGADYAEWLPVGDREEKFEPGDVVSVAGGRITKNTEGAHRVMVISTAPIVLGNQPPDGGDQDGGYQKVAFMGQAPVKVLGPVAEGDFIIPSGLHDGTGVGVCPKTITSAQFAQVVGQAWEGSEGPGLNRVRVVIGQLPPDPTVARMADRIRELEDTTATQRDETAALRDRLASLEAIVTKLTGSVKGGG